MDVAPVFPKDAGRITGLLCLEFLPPLVRAPIEREIRKARQRRHLEELSLHPEDRRCLAATATRVLAIFSGLCRHPLFEGDRLAQVFPPTHSRLQRQVLDLLGIPEDTYNA